MTSSSTARRVLAPALLAAAALLLTAPSPQQAAVALRTPSPGDPFAPLVAVVAGGAWLAAAWLLLGAAVVLGGRLPGRAGRCLRASARRALPRALRTLLEAALGTSLAVSALGGPAAAATAPGRASTDAPAAASPVATPLLDHPVAAPALDWPTTPGTTSPAPPHEPPASPAAAPAPTSALADPAPAGVVVVAPGDTLWDLAARDLARAGADAAPAAVAAAWPAWWAANRAVVGADPDLLLPGTRLVPPASR